jgi:hypothetical protein
MSPTSRLGGVVRISFDLEADLRMGFDTSGIVSYQQVGV